MQTDEKIEEIIEAPGLESFLALDRLATSLTALRAQDLGNLRPTLATFYREEAQKGDDWPKSFSASDGASGATITLKRKSFPKGVPQDVVKLFAGMSIPLKVEPRSLAVNDQYADDETILRALRRLITENPDCGVPLDMITETPSRIVVDNSTITHVLRLPEPKKIPELLSHITEISISKVKLAEGVVAEQARRIDALVGQPVTSPSVPKGKRRGR